MNVLADSSAAATLLAAVIPAALVYLRIQACLLAMPGFGERTLPGRVKVGLAMVLTPLFAGAAPPLPDGTAALILAALAQVAIGLILGLQLRVMAMMLSVAASAMAATASLSQLFGGETEMAPHPIGNLLHLAGLALLMALGLPAMLAAYLADGFALLPGSGLPAPGEVLPAMVGLVARGFQLAMILASPFILGGLLYQALSGVVGKVMPSLPVVFVGAPVAILLALLALCLFAAPILGVWSDAFFALSPEDILP